MSPGKQKVLAGAGQDSEQISRAGDQAPVYPSPAALAEYATVTREAAIAAYASRDNLIGNSFRLVSLVLDDLVEALSVRGAS